MLHWPYNISFHAYLFRLTGVVTMVWAMATVLAGVMVLVMVMVWAVTGIKRRLNQVNFQPFLQTYPTYKQNPIPYRPLTLPSSFLKMNQNIL